MTCIDGFIRTLCENIFHNLHTQQASSRNITSFKSYMLQNNVTIFLNTVDSCSFKMCEATNASKTLIFVCSTSYLKHFPKCGSESCTVAALSSHMTSNLHTELKRHMMKLFFICPYCTTSTRTARNWCFINISDICRTTEMYDGVWYSTHTVLKCDVRVLLMYITTISFKI